MMPMKKSSIEETSKPFTLEKAECYLCLLKEVLPMSDLDRRDLLEHGSAEHRLLLHRVRFDIPVRIL